jgi:acetoin utilization protein AcuB
MSYAAAPAVLLPRSMMITAEDLMTPNPARLPLTATVGEALTTLRELDARHLPIVTLDRELIGMVSDRDLGQLPLAEWSSDDRIQAELAQPLSTVMSTSVITVEADTPLDEIVDLMIEHKVGALPVVRPDGKTLVGIISYIDVLRALKRRLEAGEPIGDEPGAGAQR